MEEINKIPVNISPVTPRMIFTLPMLTLRWKMKAKKILEKIYSDRRAIYLWLKGETIYLGHFTSGSNLEISNALHYMRKCDIELQQASLHICDSYERLQLMILKELIQKLADKETYITVKDLEIIPYGENKNITNYRKLISLKKIQFNLVFFFAEQIIQHELNKNIVADTSIDPISIDKIEDEICIDIYYPSTLSKNEIHSLKQQILEETPRERSIRIKQKVKSRLEKLKLKHPHKVIHKNKVTQMIYKEEQLIYESIGKKQTSLPTYNRESR